MPSGPHGPLFHPGGTSSRATLQPKWGRASRWFPTFLPHLTPPSGRVVCSPPPGCEAPASSKKTVAPGPPRPAFRCVPRPHRRRFPLPGLRAAGRTASSWGLSVLITPRPSQQHTPGQLPNAIRRFDRFALRPLKTERQPVAGSRSVRPSVQRLPRALVRRQAPGSPRGPRGGTLSDAGRPGRPRAARHRSPPFAPSLLAWSSQHSDQKASPSHSWQVTAEVRQVATLSPSPVCAERTDVPAAAGRRALPEQSRETTLLAEGRRLGCDWGHRGPLSGSGT